MITEGCLKFYGPSILSSCDLGNKRVIVIYSLLAWYM